MPPASQASCANVVASEAPAHLQRGTTLARRGEAGHDRSLSTGVKVGDNGSASYRGRLCAQESLRVMPPAVALFFCLGASLCRRAKLRFSSAWPTIEAYPATILPSPADTSASGCLVRAPDHGEHNAVHRGAPRSASTTRTALCVHPWPSARCATLERGNIKAQYGRHVSRLLPQRAVLHGRVKSAGVGISKLWSFPNPSRCDSHPHPPVPASQHNLHNCTQHRD